MRITKIIALPKFKRDVKKLNKKHYSISKIIHVINLMKLRRHNLLNRRYYDHALHGDMQGLRELHIEKNLLLVYEFYDNTTLELLRCSSHDKIFNK